MDIEPGFPGGVKEGKGVKVGPTVAVASGVPVVAVAPWIGVSVGVDVNKSSGVKLAVAVISPLCVSVAVGLAACT